MNYTSFEYYVNEFGGKKFENDDDGFEYYLRKASATLKHHTMGRIDELTDAVQDCCCSIMEYLSNADTLESNDIASESLANHSITYRGGKTIVEKESDIKGIIRVYLGYDWVAYSGFNR